MAVFTKRTKKKITKIQDNTYIKYKIENKKRDKSFACTDIQTQRRLENMKEGTLTTIPSSQFLVPIVNRCSNPRNVPA